MSKELVNKYFPEIDFDENNYHDKGYISLSVSVFDHILSEQEADNCVDLTYSIAINRGAVDQYFEGERKFTLLYKRLASNGVLASAGSGEIMRLDSGGRFDQVVADSLREKRHMDVYFIAYDLRVIGGFDRTDLFLVKNIEQMDRIRAIIGECGLFVLENQ